MKLLVVVDYQKDFVDGSLGFPGAEKLDDRICEKIKEYEANGNAIFYTMDTHDEDYLNTREGRMLPVEHCIKGTPGWMLYGKTRKLLEGNKKAIMLMKESFGVHPGMLTSGYFEFSEPVESVEFVGLVSNICVISNVVTFQARFPQAQMIVDSKATDSFDKELNEQTMNVLRGLQVQVI